MGGADAVLAEGKRFVSLDTFEKANDLERSQPMAFIIGRLREKSAEPRTRLTVQTDVLRRKEQTRTNGTARLHVVWTRRRRARDRRKGLCSCGATSCYAVTRQLRQRLGEPRYLGMSTR